MQLAQNLLEQKLSGSFSSGLFWVDFPLKTGHHQEYVRDPARTKGKKQLLHLVSSA